MEAGITTSILVALLFAALFFVIGFIAGRSTKKTVQTHGNLNVDCSDPANGVYLYLELSTSIPDVAEQKQVAFNVHVIR